jgi:hypothetical protein
MILYSFTNLNSGAVCTFAPSVIFFSFKISLHATLNYRHILQSFTDLYFTRFSWQRSFTTTYGYLSWKTGRPPCWNENFLLCFYEISFNKAGNFYQKTMTKTCLRLGKTLRKKPPMFVHCTYNTCWEIFL